MVWESTETELRRGNAASVGGAGGVEELAVVGKSENREDGCDDCLGMERVRWYQSGWRELGEEEDYL